MEDEYIENREATRTEADKIANTIYYRAKRMLLRDVELSGAFRIAEVSGEEAEGACIQAIRDSISDIAIDMRREHQIRITGAWGLLINEILSIIGGLLAIKALWTIVNLSTGR